MKSLASRHVHSEGCEHGIAGTTDVAYIYTQGRQVPSRAITLSTDHSVATDGNNDVLCFANRGSRIGRPQVATRRTMLRPAFVTAKSLAQSLVVPPAPDLRSLPPDMPDEGSRH